MVSLLYWFNDKDVYSFGPNTQTNHIGKQIKQKCAHRYLCFKNKQLAQNQLMVHIKKRLRDTFVRFSIGRLYGRFIRGDKSSESSKSTVAKSTKLGGSLKGTTASTSACTYTYCSRSR